ncbi:ECF transporter S component [Metabacillus litoralis]|uniref:ECF transporter S component n=1 Tax=Metabacillus litoralis TaxID=152268 RepID=UPI001CFE225C|nr:ECF transporter S component [Metabacillus litoralis]
MARSRIIVIPLFLLIGIILITTPFLVDNYFIPLSLLIMILSFLPFIIRFERRNVAGRELVLLAVLAAIAAVSRIPFASLPSVQPTSFVIIVSALVFGAESGFVIGALAALVSNLFLGQGPWTPWQMYAWGMIGLSAGLLRNTWIMKNIVGKVIFGFITGILFGWLMNLWYFVSLDGSVTMAAIIAVFTTSFYFDLAHALSNVFFLLVFGNSWLKILQRFRKKYGLLDE